MELDDLKAAIAVRLDETELLDILGLTINDLVELLEEEICECRAELERAVGCEEGLYSP